MDRVIVLNTDVLAELSTVVEIVAKNDVPTLVVAAAVTAYPLVLTNKI